MKTKDTQRFLHSYFSAGFKPNLTLPSLETPSLTLTETTR